MDEVKYQQEISIAQSYSERSEFTEAEKHYRRALRAAPPALLQETIDKINDAKAKAKATPKPDKVELKRYETGFYVQSVKFKDVIGYDRHKKLIGRCIKLPLEQPDRYRDFNMAMSTGILLYGPPGTGKTLLAKSISGEYGIPMKDVHVSDILDKLVGGSEKNMRKAFDDAKQCQPAILFFDELDALGASRESANEVTNNDIKNTINEFLKQLSELHDSKEQKVFVIGATNLPWLIDDAIKRSGRLEHFYYIRPPTFLDRRNLFRYYLELEKGYAKVNLTLLSLATMRYSQADIEKVCSAVKRLVIDTKKPIITSRDVQVILKDKNEGRSSLDEWVLKAKTTYLKNEKVIVRRTGILGWRRQKERITESGKLSDGEKKIYKPMLDSIGSMCRWWLPHSVVRFMARGIL